jgi:5'-methylthioadenosine phosphorylase
MCYACLAVVTNYAAGIGKRPLSHGEIVAQMKKAGTMLQNYVVDCLIGMPEKIGCTCRTAPGRL